MLALFCAYNMQIYIYIHVCIASTRRNNSSKWFFFKSSLNLPFVGMNKFREWQSSGTLKVWYVLPRPGTDIFEILAPAYIVPGQGGRLWMAPRVPSHFSSGPVGGIRRSLLPLVVAYAIPSILSTGGRSLTWNTTLTPFTEPSLDSNIFLPSLSS